MACWDLSDSLGHVGMPLSTLPKLNLFNAGWIHPYQGAWNLCSRLEMSHVPNEGGHVLSSIVCESSLHSINANHSDLKRCRELGCKTIIKTCEIFHLRHVSESVPFEWRPDWPGLKRTIARRQPSSVLSICISFILETNSVRTLQKIKIGSTSAGGNLFNFRFKIKILLIHHHTTQGCITEWQDLTPLATAQLWLVFVASYLSKMDPTPALWALLLWTWRPVANNMPSLTVTERCEKEAMSSSFQPEKIKHKLQNYPSNICCDLSVLPVSPQSLSSGQVCEMSHQQRSALVRLQTALLGLGK